MWNILSPEICHSSQGSVLVILLCIVILLQLMRFAFSPQHFGTTEHSNSLNTWSGNKVLRLV
jgi:hypothetical protein